MTKAIKRVIAGISAAAIVAGAAVGGWAIGVNSNRSDNTFDPANGGLIIDNSEGNGVSIVSTEISAEDYAEYGVNALADSASTLTATVTPADAINNTFTWTVAWQDSGDSWASGKSVNDYIQLSSSTSTSGQAITVTCLKDFGEQIVVTATNSEDSGLSASCVCEYQTRLLDIEFNLNDGRGWYSPTGDSGDFDEFNTAYGSETTAGTDNIITLPNYDTDSPDWYNDLTVNIYGRPVFSAGTIEFEEISNSYTDYDYDAEYYHVHSTSLTIPSVDNDGGNDFGGFYSAEESIYLDSDMTEDGEQFEYWVYKLQLKVSWDNFFDNMFCDARGTMGSGLTTAQKNELYSLLQSYESEYGEDAPFIYVRTQDYTGESHTFYYDFSYSSLATRATGTNMSESTLVF